MSGQQENMLEFRVEVQASNVNFRNISINGTFREVKWAEINEEVNADREERRLEG